MQADQAVGQAAFLVEHRDGNAYSHWDRVLKPEGDIPVIASLAGFHEESG